MSESEMSERERELRDEIEEFNREKERIRSVIGRLGGTKYSKRDNVINFVFLAIIVIFFTLEVSTKFLPANISLEISVLLVSIKIVWMMHSQYRYNHFVFWILNTIEFRVNDIGKQVRRANSSPAAPSEQV